MRNAGPKRRQSKSPRHRVNKTSLRLWLKEAGIEPTRQKIVEGRVLNLYDKKRATAVACFLRQRPKVSVGRPPKSKTAEENSNEYRVSHKAKR